MATLSKPVLVGYEYEFVDQVPEDYFCKLCKHVARKPNITTCCIEVFCKYCVDAIIQDKKPCPSCENSNVSSILQVKYKSKILALEVRCTMKDRGCEWTGQLQHLDAHLDVTTGDCEYVDVECPKKCVQKVQKRNVDTHLANECPNRDYRCPHCNFANKYHVVSKHFDVCPYYPLACPNRCGATFERDDLPDHMKMCRLEEVQCVFGNEGCQAKFIRENEDEHMDQNTQKHLALMPAATLRISQDFEQKLQEQQVFGQKLQEQQEVFEKKMKQQKEENEQKQEQLGGQLQELLTQIDKQSREFQKQLDEQQIKSQELTKEKDAQIKGLKEQQIRNRQLIEQQQQAISQLCRDVGIPPHDITFSDYQQEKAKNGYISSPPMYTHPGGYKFKLSLCPNGRGSGTNTHVSVYVFSLKSDHDAELKIPVKFTITLQLLNQHRNQDHHTRDIQCEIKTKENIGILYNIGGDSKFIPLADLEWNRDKQTQYLKDDCLRFRITKIVVQ